jgi:hypothetical protein
MSKVFSAHAVSVDGYISGRHVHLRLLEAIPAPGVTHLHYEVVR